MGLHCLLHLPLMPWPHLAPSLCPPSAENVTALCPCSEPGEQCEKGQGWHVPYGILREAWQQRFFPGLAVPQSILWARGRASFLPTSDPGMSCSSTGAAIPIQRGLEKWGCGKGRCLASLSRLWPRHRVPVWLLAGRETRL